MILIGSINNLNKAEGVHNDIAHIALQDPVFYFNTSGHRQRMRIYPEKDGESVIGM